MQENVTSNYLWLVGFYGQLEHDTSNDYTWHSPVLVHESFSFTDCVL